MHRQHFVALYGLSVAAAIGFACTRPDQEQIGTQGAELVAAAATNHPASGTFFNRSESTATYVRGFIPGPVGHQGGWVASWNTNNLGPAWAFSTDNNATGWISQEASNPFAFGTPPNGNCDNSPFANWTSGDTWLASDWNPATNNGFLRVFYTGLGNTNATGAEGVVIAVSDNGGQTFNSATWVDDGQTCGTSSAIVDTPTIATHVAAPYGNWVTWDDFNTHTSNVGKMQRVTFTNPDSGLPTLVKSFPQAIDIQDGVRQRHRIAVGLSPTPCLSGGEMVHTISTSGFWSGRCPPGSNRCSAPGTPNWTIRSYDVNSNNWYPSSPTTVATETGQCPGNTAPNCLTDQARVYNSPDPSIAAHPFTSDFWVATLIVKNGSNRVHVDGYTLICGGNGPTYQHQNSTTTPDPCDPANPACHSPDGGIIIQDEWQPSVGFTTHFGKPTVVLTWYGTRDDTANHFVGYYMMYSEDGGFTWSPVQLISKKTDPNTIDPWDPNIPSFLPMWDYNNMGVDPYTQRFLPIWGGDNRTPGNGVVNTELLQ